MLMFASTSLCVRIHTPLRTSFLIVGPSRFEDSCLFCARSSSPVYFLHVVVSGGITLCWPFSFLATQVAEEAAVSRGGGGNVVADVKKGGGGGAEEAAFEYPEEPVVKLDPSQHVLYCCPSKDPTEQNCGEEHGDGEVVVLSIGVAAPVVVVVAATSGAAGAAMLLS